MRPLDFSAARLLVVGDVMLDRYWQGPAARISPEAPVPVVRVAEREDRPGGAGNVARNVAALGAHCELLGITGTDEAADALQRCLTAQPGLHCVFMREPQATTITKLRIVSHHQQLIRLDFEATFPELSAQRLVDDYQARLADADVVILSDYAKGTLQDPQRLIEIARLQETPIVVDPKGRDFSRYRQATLLTPNRAEFEAIVGPCDDDQTFAERGMNLCRELALDAILITRSERGMTLVSQAHPALHLPAHAQEVYDVTGAGDTVIASLATAVASGLALEKAARIANHAAGIAVSKLGTATVTATELLQTMQQHEPPAMQGVVDEDDLAVLIAQAKAQGERIVMTNGCFDLLHPGHVAYLEQAREWGDRLVVAVNDDKSVRRLKGPKRPVNTLSDRMAVLAGLASVDWVVPFSEDTPERVICRLQPDVLIKGGDYAPHEIAGADCVVAQGGRVVLATYLPGHSTSRTIDKLQHRQKGS